MTESPAELLALAKLAAIEKVVELLLVETIERSENPIAAADRLAEGLRASEFRHPAGGATEELRLVMSETLNGLFDRVVANLRARGHQA